MAYEKAERLKAEDFKRLCGVHRETFDRMVETVKKGLPIKKKTGRPSKLRLEDQVLMTLEYWREYRTYFHIGQSWGVDETTAYRIIRKIEDILIKAPEFHLPGKKQLLQESDGEETVIVDVTETPVEKPKKKQKSYYSGKKKKHRLKAQIILEEKSERIICTAYGKGREHDFRIYKNSEIALPLEKELLGDKGYQGIQKLHANSQTPKKKPRGGRLSEVEKKQNRQLARRRVIVENIFRWLKIFRILSERYRNRRKRFGLRFNLIASLYNLELARRLNHIAR